jgi:tRNA A37 N6-isopentenylltransferase MiaA
MEIRLKKGSRVKSDATTIFNAVEAAKIDGDVDLQTLVDQARPKDAPLHNEFTWADKKAANQWRLHEARRIVQSIEIVHHDTPPTRAWESVKVEVVAETPEEKPQRRQVFRSVNEIMADPVARNDLLVQAIRDYQSLRRRYAGLQELAKVHAAIDSVIVDTKAA